MFGLGNSATGLKDYRIFILLTHRLKSLAIKQVYGGHLRCLDFFVFQAAKRCACRRVGMAGVMTYVPHLSAELRHGFWVAVTELKIRDRNKDE